MPFDIRPLLVLPSSATLSSLLLPNMTATPSSRLRNIVNTTTQTTSSVVLAWAGSHYSTVQWLKYSTVATVLYSTVQYTTTQTTSSVVLA